MIRIVIETNIIVSSYIDNLRQTATKKNTSCKRKLFQNSGTDLEQNIQQLSRYTALSKIIESNLEGKNGGSTFLDVSQAFDIVWHKEQLHKIIIHFPYHYYKLFVSYLDQRHFEVKCGDAKFRNSEMLTSRR